MSKHLVHNFLMALKHPRWRWALLTAVIADILSFVLVLLPPVQWLLDALTAVLLFVALGFRWTLLPVLIVETIPVIELFPSWTLFVMALASAETPESKSTETIEHKDR